MCESNNYQFIIVTLWIVQALDSDNTQLEYFGDSSDILKSIGGSHEYSIEGAAECDPEPCNAALASDWVAIIGSSDFAARETEMMVDSRVKSAGMSEKVVSVSVFHKMFLIVSFITL